MISKTWCNSEETWMLASIKIYRIIKWEWNILINIMIKIYHKILSVNSMKSLITIFTMKSIIYRGIWISPKKREILFYKNFKVYANKYSYRKVNKSLKNKIKLIIWRWITKAFHTLRLIKIIKILKIKFLK